MFYIKRILLGALLLFGSTVIAQNNFEGLGETAFSLNHKVNSNYKFNFSTSSRYYFYQQENYSFEFRQVDFVHFSTFSLNYNHSLSLGVQYRIREAIDGESNELRLTQQFNYTKRRFALRFGHRVRLEQRIQDQLTIWRSRYRFALDFPLNGEKLDVGEGYVITSMEALLSLSDKIKPEVDHRTTAHVGWLISEKLKIQIGMQYRFEAFNIDTEEKLFILSSFILKV